ncbi:putative integrase/tyrosine recombinase [Halobacteriovorax marinus SJ]|uniref:Integrase/tyrosine recombinase n=1 Tax=Halobacteriovorax marinus (strain ATCC BAA-682 / DSM 15412 / SJ) TaxID=862908 RepID=E1X1E1_HALMS|nr:tyrosine-type recombinase/integrase [Halobacteriovorax marinus]CBW26532.1 putative integrase/tyrosine recombinase [Halobacteriovorax marinus SJ]
MGERKLESSAHPFTIYQEFFDNFNSLHTRRSYEIDIRHFFSWAHEQFNISSYGDLERDHIIKYRNFLQEAGGRDGSPCAPKTVARKLAALSSYSDFLVERSILEFNPVTSIKRPRRDVKTPTNALSGTQVRELLEAIPGDTPAGILHRALLMMFFTTGLRKSEILNLKFKDYREINEYRVLEFIGKGGKIGQKVLHPDAVELLDLYLVEMQRQGRELGQEDWLFQPSHNPTNPQNLNKPLNPRTINEIIDYYAKKIGLNFKVTPHSCRATFIGELLENGVDIYSVAREVNHSSVKTTQEYDKRRKRLSDSPIFKLKY